MLPRRIRWLIVVIGACAAGAYVCIYARGLQTSPVHSDAFSYYVYLPATIIYGDPTLDTLARRCCGDRYPSYTAIVRWPRTRRWVNAHPIGVAVMAAPLFLAADVLVRWANLPRDGFWFAHVHAAGLAGPLFLGLGLAWLARALLRLYPPAIVMATLVIVTFGTNVFHYATWDSLYSHVYSFALVAALLAAAPDWYAQPTVRRTVALGILGGLIVLLRHPNALLLAVVPLYGLFTTVTVRERAAWIRAHAGHVGLGLAVSALVVLPQLLLYHHATRRWLVSSYGSFWFDFAHPHVFGVLFSVQKGLFFWSPLLLLGIAGLYWLRGPARAVLVPILVILPIHTWLLASWYDWQLGWSYGHRGFTDLLALLAVPMAAALQRCSVHAWSRRLAAAAVTMLVLLSVAQMIQVWLGVMPMVDVTWPRYRALFLRFSA